MNSALIEAIVNQLIGAVIGLVVSFATSWYFYKKADMPTRIIRHMISELSLSTLFEKLNLDPEAEENMQSESPKDLDVPHIWRLWRSHKQIRPGGAVNILFSVRDTGLNFGGDIAIEDKKTGLPFKAISRVYGYWSAEIKIPDDAQAGHHQIMFQLKDFKGKTNTQFIDIEVMRGLFPRIV